MHVYVTLGLFFREVEKRCAELENIFGSLGDLDPALQARRCLDRAHFLSVALRGHDGELGLAGRRFLTWLTNILEAFDSDPPPPETDVHLLLDLYERETERLESQLSAVTASPLVSRLVDKITNSEVTKASEIALQLGRVIGIAFQTIDGDMPAKRLRSKRAWVSQCLRSIPLDAYNHTLRGTTTPAQLVREMIEEVHDDVRALEAELELEDSS